MPGLVEAEGPCDLQNWRTGLPLFTSSIRASGEEFPELNEIKLQRYLRCTTLHKASETIYLQATGSPVGFAGPVGASMPIYADFSICTISDGVELHRYEAKSGEPVEAVRAVLWQVKNSQ